VKLDFSTYKLYYYSSADSWVEITTLDAFSASDQSFHPIKLVVDFDTLKYDRVIVDNTLYDLSSFSLYSAVSALNQRILWEVTLEGLNTTGGQLYVDDAIFTQEEP
jgi:EAL domain-containing protein (putative c-di-GMP-specific phosphodiesterase class I)